MSKNPLVNGLAAFVYIIFIVLIMNFGTKMTQTHSPNSFIAPVAVVSLFTLSAAVMGYIFCYQPIQLYFEGKKRQAINLFLQTVAVFGCFTIFILLLLFSGVFA